MPDWLSAILLGLIEGLTEFIPVSSTGHLLIAEKWLGHRPDWFNVFIQVGAALALLPIFWTKLMGLLVTWQKPESRDYLLKLTVAFGITGVGCLITEKMHIELPKTVGPVAWATLIGAVVIWGIEAWRKNHQGHNNLTWTIVIVCALAQILAAIFPGTSRSGATIMAALAFGLARFAAAEFSFVLGMVTLTAAGGYKLLDAWKDGEIHGGKGAMDVTLAFLAAAVSAFIVVKWLLRFVQYHNFNGFAIYRFILGAVLLVWFMD